MGLGEGDGGAMMASIGVGVGLLAPYGAIENVTFPEGLKLSQDIIASAVTVLLGLTVFGTSVRNMLQPPYGGTWAWLNTSTSLNILKGSFYCYKR
jgi:hypothetical protein